jgi:hypothetical protein
MLELHRILGQYRGNVVVIGGWVPELLHPHDHVGSTDVDLALDHKALTEVGYETIERLLLDAGYERGAQPNQYIRKAVVEGKEIEVPVDLLAGEYGGVGRRRRHQRIQDVLARKARGSDLAFRLSEDVEIEGELPRGGRFAVAVRVASDVPFLVMKALALDERDNPKDAYDILYCIDHFPGGPEALADRFGPHVGRPIVQEALEKLAKNFASPDHVGPRSVAAFEDELADDEERVIVMRRAFEEVNRLLVRLGLGQEG